MSNEIHCLDVMGKTLAHARPHDLDGDLLPAFGALDLGRMHLRDRGGGNRIAEARIELADRPSERAFDIGLGGSRGKEGHAVLKLRQVVGEFDADDIRPRCQELSDLHIRGTEPLDSLGQPVAALLMPRLASLENRDEGFGERDRRRQPFGRKG